MAPIINIQPGEAGQRDEEAEAGARGWCRGQVDAAHSTATAMITMRMPRSSGCPVDARAGRGHAHHRPRSYSTIALICSSVSRLPKPGIRPVPWPCWPYRLPTSEPARDEVDHGRPRSGMAVDVEPPVRFRPKAPPPGTLGIAVGPALGVAAGARVGAAVQIEVEQRLAERLRTCRRRRTGFGGRLRSSGLVRRPPAGCRRRARADRRLLGVQPSRGIWIDLM